MPYILKEEGKVKVYSLQEMLNDPELKKNLLAKHQLDDGASSWNVIQDFIHDDVQSIKEELAGMGFEGKIDIAYDLSYSQGSGASFDFEQLNIHELALWETKTPLEKRTKWGEYIEDFVNVDQLYDLMKAFPNAFDELDKDNSWPKVYSQTNSFANHYTHHKTRNICFSDFDVNEDSVLGELIDTKDFQEVYKDIQQAVEKIYEDICHYIYAQLQKTNEYCQSEEFTMSEIDSQYGNHSLFYDTGIYYGDLEEGPNLQQSIRLVIQDQSGDYFSYNDNPYGEGDFKPYTAINKPVIYSNLEYALSKGLQLMNERPGLKIRVIPAPNVFLDTHRESVYNFVFIIDDKGHIIGAPRENYTFSDLADNPDEVHTILRFKSYEEALEYAIRIHQPHQKLFVATFKDYKENRIEDIIGGNDGN